MYSELMAMIHINLLISTNNKKSLNLHLLNKKTKRAFGKAIVYYLTAPNNQFFTLKICQSI